MSEFFVVAQTCQSISLYQNISEQTLFCIYSEWIWGKIYFLIAEIWDFIYVNKIYGKLWGDDIINSLICIFISTVQESFDENYGHSKCHIFLIFYLIYFKLSLFCSKLFYSFCWINSNLESISPLSRGVTTDLKGETEAD